jgi:hypothetical protein
LPRLAAFGALAAAVAAAAWTALVPADAALALLFVAGFVIVAGVAWFESGPGSSKELVLIATLAAAAAAGRVLFAAIPNVQPVTVIAVVAGVALGPRAGATVGALAALVSNFYLGQGAYTPWQMLAWGSCGLIGGLAAPLLRRRVPLALTCFASPSTPSWTSGSGSASTRIPGRRSPRSTCAGSGSTARTRPGTSCSPSSPAPSCGGCSNGTRGA